MSRQEHTHHITPQGTLWRTWAVLMVLMVLTIVVALAPYTVRGLERMQDFSVFNNLVALGIAAIKAVLVVQVFMGAKYSSKLIKIFAYGGFLWLLVLSIIFLDYWSRPMEPVPGWEPLAPGALPRDRSDVLPSSPYVHP